MANLYLKQPDINGEYIKLAEAVLYSNKAVESYKENPTLKMAIILANMHGIITKEYQNYIVIKSWNSPSEGFNTSLIVENLKQIPIHKLFAA